MSSVAPAAITVVIGFGFSPSVPPDQVVLPVIVSEPGPRTEPLVRLKLWTVEPSMAEFSLRSPLATVTRRVLSRLATFAVPAMLTNPPVGAFWIQAWVAAVWHAGRPVRRASTSRCRRVLRRARGAGLRAGTHSPGPLCVEDRQQHDQCGAERSRTAQQGSPTTSHDASHGDLRVGRETRPPGCGEHIPRPPQRK